MITVNSLGGKTIKIDINGTVVTAFPDTADDKAQISLLGSPEEEVKPGVVSWPGEYDIGGIAIRGIGHDEGQRVSYALDDGKVRVAFLSAPLHDWTDHNLELLGDVDILCIPADDAKIAQKLIDEVDPRVLVPLPTKDEATFVELLKAVGAQDKEIESEYKLKGGLPSEGREVVILKPSK
ncbi:MAG: MBL fold metallo-hydrolase [Candidatus Peribacteraceae bacterium]|jgi:hypothetical protein|nr:MBL fold metallo-hydrolase [Candidatus Peribacteraceae bacterium]|tara:strand:+ start:11813 stop:12352 length:540 start_codon:yes stop_codon:yes gene_type:complete